MSRPESFRGQKLILVGNSGATHIGSHLYRAAENLGLKTLFLNVEDAFKGPWITAKFNWWFRGHLPNRFKAFNETFMDQCRKFGPRWVLATGIAPLSAGALEKAGGLGIQRINYLTDDPWNPAHRTLWFTEALPFYDQVFSVRRANIEDLRKLNCPNVSYLPFAYEPSLHYPEPAVTEAQKEEYSCDIVFVGGADPDRLVYMTALLKAGFKISLYGGYWDRYHQTRAYAHGHADPRTMRLAISGAKTALCLVRRANRDDNSMRTFEIPAIGGCMLAEDTKEHRAIFGEEGNAVVYFKATGELVEKIKFLTERELERKKIAAAAQDLILHGHHTYLDRLITMLENTA